MEEQINQTKWMRLVTRPMSPLKFPMITVLAESFKRILGVGFEHQIYFPVSGQHAFYFSESEFTAFREAVITNIRNVEGYIIEQAKNCYQTCEEFINLGNKINSLNIESLPTLEIKQLYLEFNEKMMEYTVYLWIPLVIERYLPTALEKTGKLSKEEIDIVSTKTRLTPSDRAGLELLKIAVDIENNKGAVDNKLEHKIEKHAEEFGWLPTHDFHLEVWKKEHFLAKLKQISNAKEKFMEKERAMETVEKKLQDIKQKMKSEKVVLKLIDELQEYLFLRTYRTDALYQAIYSVLPLIEEIGRRADLAKDEVVFLSPWELINFLEYNQLPKHDEIKKRKDRYVLMRIEGKERIVSDSVEIDKIGKILKIEEVEGATVLRGQGIYPGYAKGVVKIILNVQEGEKIRGGDILVSTMTTPEMHLFIEKVSAIVTDEGGITSHAALISRELGIPCVIGTEKATQILQNGDLVEVDSKSGIVRRLEK